METMDIFQQLLHMGIQASTKGIPIALASCFPTVDLPQPMYPIKTMTTVQISQLAMKIHWKKGVKFSKIYFGLKSIIIIFAPANTASRVFWRRRAAFQILTTW